MRAPCPGGTTQCPPAITAAGSSARAGCSSPRVDSRSHTAEPSGFCMWSKAWRSRMASSSACAGSKLASRSAAMPISGVFTDWCCPPSGASVRPDGVETSRKRASW